MTRLIIGTRGSPLARWQAEHVASSLKRDLPALEVEIRIIRTKGDKIQDVPLAKVGGKGLFVKEIEEQLLDHGIDLAVHSIKDLPAQRVPGLAIGAILEREDPRDALVSCAGSLTELPAGARVGTSSLRRRCQILNVRPDLTVQDLRGNVDTRLAKLDSGMYDAIILAAAGLKRLGREGRITEVLDSRLLLPAVGQGALAVEVRQDSPEVADLVRRLHHDKTARAVGAERAFLAELSGGCQVPVAAHATLGGGALTLEGLIGHPSGAPTYRSEVQGDAVDGESMGQGLARELLNQGGGAILTEVMERA